MQVKSLARGRMCVHKIIAEPERRGPHEGRQAGLRGNSIGFPQARVKLLESKELPAPPEESAQFLSETVVIAMVGSDINELHKAKWAEIRRTPYLDAAKLLVSHSTSYSDMSVAEERAKNEFAESGRSSEAVLQQAVPILATEELKHRLEGPADTGCAGERHEQTVAVDGEMAESDEEAEENEGEPHFNAAIPDPEFPEAALPTMNIVADELTSGDLDEVRAIKKVQAEMEALQEAIRKDVEADVVAGVPKRRRARAKDKLVQLTYVSTTWGT